MTNSAILMGGPKLIKLGIHQILSERSKEQHSTAQHSTAQHTAVHLPQYIHFIIVLQIQLSYPN